MPNYTELLAHVADAAPNPHHLAQRITARPETRLTELALDDEEGTATYVVSPLVVRGGHPDDPWTADADATLLVFVEDDGGNGNAVLVNFDGTLTATWRVEA